MREGERGEMRSQLASLGTVRLAAVALCECVERRDDGRARGTKREGGMAGEEERQRGTKEERGHSLRSPAESYRGMSKTNRRSLRVAA